MNALPALAAVAASWVAATGLARRTRQRGAKILVTQLFLCAAVLLAAIHLCALAQILGGFASVRLEFVALLAVAAAVAARWNVAPAANGPGRAFLRRALHLLRTEPVLAAMLACAAWVHLLLLASTLSAPPRGFDALWYHLPNALWWYRTRTLDVQVGSYIEFYPGNGGLLGLPLLALDDDSWLGLVQYPWFLAAALIAALLARRAGASPRLGAAAGLATLTVPLLVEQATQFYVDVICAALSLGSLLYLADWIRERKTSDLLLCALSLGMMLGTKYVAVLWWAFAIAAIAALEWRRRRRDGESTPARTWLAFAVAGTGLAWIWWLRNLVYAGNPIEPVDPLFLLRVLSQGRTLGSVFGAAAALPDTLHSFALAYGAAAVLVAALPLAAIGVLRSSPARDVATISLAYVAWAFAALLLFLTPDPRFVIGPVLVCLALAAAACRRQRERACLYAFLAVAAVDTALVTRRIVWADDFAVSLNDRRRNAFYGLPDEIDRLPDESRVLLRGHPALVYPAAGAKRRNVVYPSPLGPVDEEIRKWSIDYVLVRTHIEEEIAALERAPGLVLVRRLELSDHPWWDTWSDGRPRVVALFRVVPAPR